MTREIKIVGELVQIIESTVVTEGTLEATLPFLETRIPVISPILPDNNVRAATYDDSGDTKMYEILVQLPPLVRKLDFDRPIPDIECRVAVPYTLFFIRATTQVDNPRGQDWNLEYLRVYWSKDPIHSLDQKVIPAVLPNIYVDGRVCFWTAATNAMQDLHARVDQTVNDFYLTGFTAHNVRPYEWPWKQKNYRTWAEETAKSGLQAYKAIPELDDTNKDVTHHTIAEIFENPPKPGIITLPDGIPPLEFTPTFGRAEEWVRNLQPTQVDRLERAIQIVREGQPAEAVVA